MDYKHIHENIMKSDPKIRLVTICDLNGKIMHSEHREGVRNLLTPDESKKSLDLVLAEYEKIKRITMPLGDSHLLYVTTEIDADHSVVINSIAKLDLQ